ncbi:MAG: hypothetical protein EZS28_000382 [Streblomastix strix]|uniref:Protein kinase domain-containing protein n=1 Tax=Streblomastix strix TaxID=222440 RepID=A0A5J4XAC4_9EUKA|nr:MAG: hypothetical protein EZS28_000382 [Streblomastix strix]
MTVPNEYNIIDGLAGVGPDVLLVVLSEIRLISNAVQFLGVCKKTQKLMKHSRFMKIVEQLNYPISIINKDPGYVYLIDIDDVQKKINMIDFGKSTISLDQVLNNGIWSLEAMLQSTYGDADIGIVRDSYDIPANTFYWNKPHTDHIAAFGSGYLPVCYKGQRTFGNTGFEDNEILRAEFDSFKGTLVLFVDNVQQPVYLSGINEKVRFIVSMIYAGSSCTILSLKQLMAPTSKHIANEVAVQW